MAKHKKGRDIHGIFLLDKPSGLSSNHALQKVKRLFNANKAGHTGTLDPLATGMLVICLGEATKFCHYLLATNKHYHVTARLGIRTDTSDSEGKVIATHQVSQSRTQIENLLANFLGCQKQVPSMFSALKYHGKPLYEYARKGITVPRQARDIEIYSLALRQMNLPELTLEVSCSKGTYIRTLIDDMGQALGCGAHVTALHRLYAGHFKNDRMYTFNEAEAMSEQINILDRCVLPIDYAINAFPKISLRQAKAGSFKHGQPISCINEFPTTLIRIYEESTDTQQFIGVGEYRDGYLYPKRLLITT